jgi:hypothetical protein
MTRASDLARHQVAFKTALIEFTDGDDAITVADGGVVTLLNTAVVKAEGGSATNNIAQGQVKAWNRTQDGNNISTDSFNISGTTDNEAGDFDIQINNNMSNANYIVVTGADDKQDGGRVFASMVDQSQGLATTGYEIVFKGVGSSFTKSDPNTMSASAVLGDLA